MPKSDIEITTKGWTYCRFERWKVWYGGGAGLNTLYGIQVLGLKFFIGQVLL